MEKDSKLDIPIKSPLSELRESYRRTGRKLIRARGLENSRRTRPYESTNQNICDHTESKTASKGLQGSVPGPLHMYYSY